jgi:hypothetical protein
MQYMEFNGPGFTLEFPTDWLVSATQQAQTVFQGPRHQTDLHPNLMITIRQAAPGVTAPAVAEEARKTQEREYPEFKVVNEVDFTENGGAGFLRQYTWHNARNDIAVAQIQAFFVVAGVLFTLTATRAQKDDASIDDVFYHMIDTFRLQAQEAN